MLSFKKSREHLVLGVLILAFIDNTSSLNILYYFTDLRAKLAPVYVTHMVQGWPSKPKDLLSGPLQKVCAHR